METRNTASSSMVRLAASSAAETTNALTERPRKRAARTTSSRTRAGMRASSLALRGSALDDARADELAIWAMYGKFPVYKKGDRMLNDFCTRGLVDNALADLS
jgi:hypothetical protein